MGTMSFAAGHKIAFATRVALDKVCAHPAALLTYIKNIPTRRTYLLFRAGTAHAIISRLRDTSELKSVHFYALPGERTFPVICASLPSETTESEKEPSSAGVPST
jgi:ribosomal protein S12 methylthiotransferase accessory factor YcaO